MQAVQQKALPEGEQRRWAERAVRLLSATFPAPKAAAWERCQQLLSHALVCTEHIALHGFAFPEGASLLQQTGRYLYERGAYEQSLPLLQQALALREQFYGSQHGEVAQSLNDLGDLALAQGERCPFTSAPWRFASSH